MKRNFTFIEYLIVVVILLIVGLLFIAVNIDRVYHETDVSIHDTMFERKDSGEVIFFEYIVTFRIKDRCLLVLVDMPNKGSMEGILICKESSDEFLLKYRKWRTNVWRGENQR